MRRFLALFLALTFMVSSGLADTLVLPSELKVIGEEAFAGSFSFDEVVLPENIESIENRAFADSSLKRINLPSSLNSIADDAFEGTEAVQFTVEDGTYAYEWVMNHTDPWAVTAEAIYTDTFVLSWNPVDGVEEYMVYTYSDEACTDLYRAVPAENPWGTFISTDIATQYWFVVEFESEGETHRYHTATAEPKMPLDAPEHVSATVGNDGYVSLMWDPVENATGYRIYFSTENDEWDPEMEYIAFEGEPGNQELWIDEYQTMHVWVCADNGDGINRLSHISFIQGKTLKFVDNLSDVYRELAVFDETDILFSDLCVHTFELADFEEWATMLSGVPEWSAVLIEGADTGYEFLYPNEASADFNVGIPEQADLIKYMVTCSWDGYEVVGYVTLNYLIPSVLPTGISLGDEITLYNEEVNTISCSFEPEGFSFGYDDFVRVNDFGTADSWNDGHTLFIQPHETGDFWADVEVRCANMGVVKNVLFHVVNRYDISDLTVEAPWTDTYDVSWSPIEGIDDYTVYVYTDEECTHLYRIVKAENPWGTTVLTDTGVQYWFVMECTDGENVYRYGPVTTEPLSTMSAPENLDGYIDETGTVHLFWDAVEEATGYRVYYSTEDYIWTYNTPFIAFEGGPGNEELQVEGNDIIHIWVCADNGEGPNDKTYLCLRRITEDDTDQVLDFLESDNEPSDFRLSAETLTHMSSEGVTDEAELERISEYNAAVDNLNDAIDHYNESLDRFVGFLDDVFADINMETNENSYSVTYDGNTYQISSEVAELLNQDCQIVDSHALDDMLVYEIISEGRTYYLAQNDTGLFLVDSIAGERENQQTLRGPANSEARGLYDLVYPLLDPYKNMMNKIMPYSSYYNDLYGGLEWLDLAFTGLKEFIIGDDIKDVVSGIGNANLLVGLAGIPAKIEAAGKAHRKLLELFEIANHDHATPGELAYDYSFEISRIMNDKIGAAIWCLRSEYLNNLFGAYRIAEGIKKKLMGIETDSTRVMEKTWFKALDKTAGSLMDVAYKKANELYQDIKRYDRELHYDVQGVIKDARGNAIPNVWVTCLGNSVLSDNTGYYSLEVPYDMNYLVFSKDGYFDQPVQVACEPYITSRKDVTLKRKPWGTVQGVVKDEFGDPVINVVVSCGEYHTKTSNQGRYSLLLPGGERTLTYRREGYIDTSETVIVEDEKVTPQDAVLSWKYGLTGTVVDQNGPVSGARVSIYIRNSSRPEVTVSTDENGNYRYKLSPGTEYSVHIIGPNHICADFLTTKQVKGFIVTEDRVTKVNGELYDYSGQYHETIVCDWWSGANTPPIKPVRTTFSWEGHTAVNEKGLGFICVSKTKDIYLTISASCEVEGITYTKTFVGYHVDLTTRKNGWTYIPFRLGYYWEGAAQ